MAPLKKHVHGMAELDAQLKELGGKTVYILFCGGKTPTGESWCPDCVKAEPVVLEAADKLLPNTAILIHCDVGLREEWKTPTNQFRHDERFRLTAVPTLLQYKTEKRLVEDECCDMDMLSLIFEPDD